MTAAGEIDIATVTRLLPFVRAAFGPTLLGSSLLYGC